MGFCFCKKGDVLFMKGEEASYFYVLLAGQVN
jgi:CRP-like cAMP-binding protein